MQMCNFSAAETRIFQENKGNTVAADDLAPPVTRSSAAIVLAMYNRCVPNFRDKGLQPPPLSQLSEMSECKYSFMFS